MRAIPSCPGAPQLRAMVLAESERLVPQADAQRLLAGDGLATGVAP